MTTFQQIFDATQTLSGSERLQLVQALWNSIPQEDWARPSEELMQEVRARSEAIDNDNMSGTSWSEARSRVRKQVGLDG